VDSTVLRCGFYRPRDHLTGLHWIDNLIDNADFNCPFNSTGNLVVFGRKF
jgi:hypothetical protein